MATTTWVAGSGDWNTASDWSNGVPTAADDAVFNDASTGGGYTVTGGGAAASLLVGGASGPNALGPTFAGTFTVGTIVDDGSAQLSGLLDFNAATIQGGGLTLLAGAALGTGAITLNDAVLSTPPATLSNPLVLLGIDTVSTTGTLSGPISGTGQLECLYFADTSPDRTTASGNLLLANPGNDVPGGLAIGAGAFEYPAYVGTVELAAGAAAFGPIRLNSGTLTLDPGVAVTSITAATRASATINAADQAATVFAGQFNLAYNGSGHAAVIGATALAPYGLESPGQFRTMTVQGGAGSVTVFGGNSSGVFYGGSAGGNVLVGGADLSSEQLSPGGTAITGPYVGRVPAPVTLVGGGSNDLLVASGTGPLGQFGPNVIVAGSGDETLTGSGSTSSNLFFGGTGAAVIAAGGGQSVIVAGSGAATISGGSGTAAIFAGGGQDIVLGGTGADYVQAGAGNATLFAGAGMDLIGVVDGQAGGSLVVAGFRVATDRISAQGYASAPVVASAGDDTVLTFSDHTRVTLLGVASLPGAAFS